MVYLIGGASHTGKTCLAQSWLEKHHYTYVSIDHLKMGLIRSGQTGLTPMDDEKLTDYLWPILREMIKTAVENRQNLILEGCYIPHNWRDSFDEVYLPHIRGLWLVMTEDYIRNHFRQIQKEASCIEQRLDDSNLNVNELIRDNRENLARCQKHGCDYYLIADSYPAEIPLPK